jgi:hypothetical protein
MHAVGDKSLANGTNVDVLCVCAWSYFTVGEINWGLVRIEDARPVTSGREELYLHR